MKSYNRVNLPTAAAVIALGSCVSALAATVTWDGGGVDGEWGTATNWDGDALPAAGDSVIINNGDTVNITGNILPFDLNVSFSGGSDLSYTGSNMELNSAKITLGAGSTFMANATVRVWDNSLLAFDDGASTNVAVEFRGGNASLRFNFSATGFTAIAPVNLGFWSGNDLSDVNFTIDLTKYSGGATTITLIDWSSGSGSQALLDTAKKNIISGDYTGSLVWDENTKSIQLRVTATDSKPSSATMLSLGGITLSLAPRN